MSKWELLILTQPSRAPILAQLLAELNTQCAGFDVKLTIQHFDTSLSLGTNRQMMLEHSKGEYVSFFDDDDFPAPNFIERIFPLLDRDYVGFNVQTYCGHLNYCKYGDTIHSLENGKWDRNGMTFLRDISHINPLRRELALRFPMYGGHGEDERWARGLRELGCVKTQHYIPEIMYHYIWRAAKNDATDATDPRRMALIESIRNPPVPIPVGLPNERWDA